MRDLIFRFLLLLFQFCFSFLIFFFCLHCRARLEDAEDLGGGLGDGLVRNDIESHSLGEGSAVTNGDNVADLHSESGRAVRRDVGVALLKAIVFAEVVEVVAANDDGAGHLGGDDDALEHRATDRHIASEGALLVDVLALNGSARGLEAKADVAVVADSRLALGKIKLI